MFKMQKKESNVVHFNFLVQNKNKQTVEAN